MRFKSALVCVALALLSTGAGGAGQFPTPSTLAASRGAVVGEELTHVAARGETLRKLSAWYGVDAKVIAAENGLSSGAALKPGLSIRIPNRHIVPLGTHDGILVNIPQRHLFFFAGGSLDGHYPIAVGRGDWRTPTGGFYVAVKETDPTWEVPKSIQAEMRRKGQRVLTSVAPGPDNPLGKYWIGLNRTGVGIHGTNSPDSIYRSATHGCIRMHAEDVEDLFAKVQLKTPVNVIYQPVLVGIADDGVYLEAHPDVYRNGGNMTSALQRLSTQAGSRHTIDWALAEGVLAKREGVARLVSRARTD